MAHLGENIDGGSKSSRSFPTDTATRERTTRHAPDATTADIVFPPVELEDTSPD
jgi:hypothetical protein